MFKGPESEERKQPFWFEETNRKGLASEKSVVSFFFFYCEHGMKHLTLFPIVLNHVSDDLEIKRGE